MEYPLFFEEHICGIIEDYKRERAKIANAVSFVFLTDIHIHLNGRSSVPLICKIGEETDVNTVLCGGDMCWAWGSKAECINQLEDSLYYMDPIRDTMKLYIARGNHDATVRNTREDPRGYTMPFDQLQPYYASHNSPANGVVAGKLYFYADDVAAKTRYIIVDTTEKHLSPESGWGVRTEMTQQQLDWIAAEALHLPGEEWSAVVMGHIACVPQIPDSSEELSSLRDILEAFKNRQSCQYADYTDAKGQLVAYVCGHNHVDRSAVVNNVLHVSTGCDAYCKDDIYPRDVGSVNNVLFDLFLVDKDTHTVHVFRVGAGESRKLNY